MNDDARLKRVAASHPLDAMKVAADHHRALLENETARVIDTRVAPRERTPVHGHEWSAALSVFSSSDVVRYDTSGSVLFDSRTMSQKPAVGSALWSAPIGPHDVKNVGPTELRILAVEVKAWRSSRSGLPDSRHTDRRAGSISDDRATNPGNGGRWARPSACGATRIFDAGASAPGQRCAQIGIAPRGSSCGARLALGTCAGRRSSVSSSGARDAGPALDQRTSAPTPLDVPSGAAHA